MIGTLVTVDLPPIIIGRAQKLPRWDCNLESPEMKDQCSIYQTNRGGTIRKWAAYALRGRIHVNIFARMQIRLPGLSRRKAMARTRRDVAAAWTPSARHEAS